MCLQTVEASPQAAFRQLSTLGIIGKGNILNKYLLYQRKIAKNSKPFYKTIDFVIYIALKNQATSIPEWILAKYLKREHQLIMTQPECHHQSSVHLHIQVSKSANPNDQWTMEVAAMGEV